MSRQTPEGQDHENLGAKRFGVMTQGIFITTITRLLKEIYVATQIKNKPREKVAIEKREATTEEATKTRGSVLIELSMSQQRDQFGPKFWGSTMQLMKCGPTLESL